jgi:Domain of unknown function (DUF4349)
MANSVNRSLFNPVWLGAVLMSAVLASCAAAPSSQQLSSGGAAPASVPMNAESLDNAAKLAEVAASPAPPSQPQKQPQLIKTASLQVTVKSVTSSLEQVKTIAQQQQGDILNLGDQIPTEGNRHRNASIQIRVPQAKLDAAIQALKGLGNLDSQSITAEDVSTQLVDSQARLKNLRRTEETLLEIMGRAGGVSDVLRVSQELSNVRTQIEQITAQLTALQSQVAYSSINLNLVEVTASVRSQPAVGIQISNSWESATQSFGKLTVDLLQLGIWLMVYSPYLLVLGAIGAFGYQRFKGRVPVAPVAGTTED